MPVIIDGHNLLRTIQNAEENASITDITMCRILDSYFGLTKEKAEIIFDGTGPLDKTGFNNTKNLQVAFSGRSCDCDTVIEQMILASTAPKLLTIVSSDRRSRNAASARKANSIKSEDFWDEVIKRINRQKPVKEPPGKRGGLTEAETQLWLKTFGIEQ